MHDIFGQPSPAQRTLADYHVKRMILSPSHWRHYQQTITLNWTLVQFTRANASQIPNDCSGVYSFVVQPGIAQHLTCSYLLYVGKTEQPFRKRYQAYLSDWRQGDKSRRSHVTEMLEKWEGFLWFAYAPISQTSQIVAIEDALLESYLPPCNKDFPASVSASVQRVLGI